MFVGEPMLTHFLKNAWGGVAPLMAVVAVPFHSVCRAGALPREARIAAGAARRAAVAYAAEQYSSCNTIGTNQTKLRVAQ